MSTGIDRATATQNRRVMSASSGLGPESAVTRTGSSAIPQIGHEPGPGRRISGCIGHVHSETSPLGAGVAVEHVAWYPRPPGWLRAGSASNLDWQSAEQKWTVSPS